MDDTAAAFSPTAYERLSPQERRALDFGALARSAGEVADTVLEVAAASIATRKRLVEAQVRVLVLVGGAQTTAKCEALVERATLAALGDRGRALKLLSSILQSLLRSQNL